jgi:hypothetical protein
MTSMTDKLQKLIAMERSARQIGNVAEAEAFAAKVAELLFKHNLSMSDVEVKEQEQNEPIEREYVRGKKGRCVWMEMLAGAVATSCFCRWMIVQSTSTQIFVGRTSDRQAAASLFAHLVGCATSMCNSEKRKIRDINPYVDNYERAVWARDWGKSFLLGFAMAVSKRLTDQRRDLAAESQSGAALVLRKDAAIAQWFAQQKTRSARSFYSHSRRRGIRGRTARRELRQSQGAHSPTRMNDTLKDGAPSAPSEELAMPGDAHRSDERL